MKRALLCIFAVILIIASFGSCFAVSGLVTWDEDNLYCLDTAGVLSEDTKGEIFFDSAKLDDACGAQICVVVLDTINGQSTEDYAYALFNEWGIGSADENNGFLLLMTIKEDDYYAVVGDGLTKIFPASVLKEFYDDYLENDFAAKRYDAGAKKFYEAVFAKVADFYNLDLKAKDGANDYRSAVKDGLAQRTGNGPSKIQPEKEETDDFKVILGAIILIVIIALIFRPRFRRGPRPPYYGPGPYGGPRGPYRPGPHPGPRPGPRGGGFGGGFGGGSSHSSGFGHSSSSSSRSFGSSSSSRSFGGGSSSRSSSSSRSFGGGRSSGGGAGRGRH